MVSWLKRIGPSSFQSLVLPVVHRSSNPLRHGIVLYLSLVYAFESQRWLSFAVPEHSKFCFKVTRCSAIHLKVQFKPLKLKFQADSLVHFSLDSKHWQ